MAIGVNLTRRDTDENEPDFEDLVIEGETIEGSHPMNSPTDVNVLTKWLLEDTNLAAVALAYTQGGMRKSALLLLADPTLSQDDDHPYMSEVTQYLEGLRFVTYDRNQTQVLAQFEDNPLGWKLCKLLAHAMSVGNGTLTEVDQKTVHELVEAFREEIPEEYVHEVTMKQRLEHFLEAQNVKKGLRLALRKEVMQDFHLGSKLLESNPDLQLTSAINDRTARLKHDPDSAAPSGS
mgnify:CR=1 FL=1